MRTHLSRPTAALFLSIIFALSTPVFGGPPGGQLNVEKVWADDLDNPTSIMIFGEDLDFGPGPLTVTLGGFGELTIASASATQIDATLPDIILPGDYLLTVSMGDGQSQNDEYDLTIGAVGPQGPMGPAGSASQCPCEAAFAAAGSTIFYPGTNFYQCDESPTAMDIDIITADGWRGAYKLRAEGTHCYYLMTSTSIGGHEVYVGTNPEENVACEAYLSQLAALCPSP